MKWFLEVVGTLIIGILMLVLTVAALRSDAAQPVYYTGVYYANTPTEYNA